MLTITGGELACEGEGDDKLPEPWLKRKPVVLGEGVGGPHHPGYPFSLLTKPALKPLKDPAQSLPQTHTHLGQALAMPSPGPLHVEGGV